MKTKTISLLLLLAMCVMLFAGCQDAKLHSLSEEAAANGETPAPTPTPAEPTGPKDYSAAYKAFPADQVMLTIDGIDISWGELFYWYVYEVSNIEAYFGEISDWDAKCSFDAEKTYREYVADTALELTKQNCALQKKAADMGVELSDMDNSMLEAQWTQLVESSGGEAALLAQLEASYISKDLFMKLYSIGMLYNHLLEEMYGAKGEKISDAELFSVAEDMGYMRAKHILISAKDDAGAELPAEQLAEKEARAKEIHDELAAITDKAALEARFDELVTAEGEDPGSAYYVDGYTFIYGEFNNEPFESAVKALGDYELSDVVKTDFGYHIILRLPLDRDAAVSFSSETEFTTIGSIVAVEMFNAEMEAWSKEVEIETTADFDKLDIAQIFELANQAAAAAAAVTPTDIAEPEK